MSNDPLARFRGTRTEPASGNLPPKEAEGYMAFGTKDRVQRLRIRSAMAPTQAPGYNILLNISYDGDYGTNFVLVYSVMLVLVRGKNLQKMIFAIENGMADYIQEFDADRWQRPKDSAAAFIESIQIEVKDDTTGKGSQH